MKTITSKLIHVDDDNDERELFRAAIAELDINIEVKYFSTARDALKYLKITTDRIFAIISDMNMPSMDGFEFKKIIDNDPVLCKKAIPFVFTSSVATERQVREAYEYRIQGYFEKPASISDMVETLGTIIKYWSISRKPRPMLLAV